MLKHIQRPQIFGTSGLVGCGEGDTGDTKTEFSLIKKNFKCGILYTTQFVD